MLILKKIQGKISKYWMSLATKLALDADISDIVAMLLW
jgi:hypothetical protein